MIKRDATCDLARAVAMFMVIYSHVMFYRPGFELKEMPSYAVNFIMVVAMPMFFMLSGYFSCHLHQIGNLKKLFSRFVAYFWPMAFFSFTLACFDCVVFGEFPVAQLLSKIIKTFLFSGWFFQALAICDAIVFLAYRFDGKLPKVAVLFMGYGVCLLGANKLWYVGNVVQMFPFYLLGLVFVPVVVKDGRIWFVTTCLGCGMLVWVTYFNGNIATNGMGFYYDRFDVFHLNYQKAIHLGIRIIVGLCGSLAILKIIKIMLCIFPGVARVSCLGKETLGIYFLQGWLIETIVVPFIGLNANVTTLICASCCVFLLAFFVVKILKWNEKIGNLVFGMKWT